jgi:transcriptional regulator with XRE-family HTH domain
MTGSALRQFRESQGLSQAEFAMLLGIGLRSLQ